MLRAAEDAPAFVIQNQPAPLPHTASPSTAEAFAKADLPDGQTLTVWLDGVSLQARLGETAATVIDPRASPACRPALTAFADGTALLVWRGHDDNGSRDLRFTRFDKGEWQRASTLIQDGWVTASDPLDEGPALAARGPHVAVAWFTAGEGPRVNVSTSASAGIQWLMPQRVDDVAPIGRVSVVLFDDGAQLVSWVERVADGYTLLLRRVSPRGTLSVPVQLARTASDPGHPRLTWVKDGDATPAQVLLTYTDNASPLARLITLPAASLLAEADACDCDPRPEELRGYALSGRVTAIDPNIGTITVAHGDIPGIMKATTTVFRAAPDLLAAAQTGQRLLARTERIGPDWWLLNVRTLSAPDRTR